MEALKTELAKAKEELIIAKESAIQSWLDSKPLIDELEKQKSNLAEAQQASKASKTAISELESQLQTTTNCITSKREEHLKEESTIQEIKLALNQIRHEIEDAKAGITKAKQEREKLWRIAYLRKQRIKTLRLAIRAATLELEALEESKASAVQQQVYHSINRTDVVVVTREEYSALKRTAKRKYSKANSLAAVSSEQKRAVEASHEVALSRLDKFSGTWSMERRRVTRELYSSKRVVGEGTVENNKGRRELSPKVERGKVENKNGIRMASDDVRVMKKKKCVLHKVRKCFGQNTTKLRG